MRFFAILFTYTYKYNSALIKNELESGKRYRDIIDMYPEAKLSPMTISRIFKSVKNDDKRNEVKKIRLEDKQIVYIYTDDSFANTDRFKKKRWKKFKRNKDTQIRTISFCTGYDEKTLDLVHNYNILRLPNYKIHFHLYIYLTFVLHLENNIIKIVDKIEGYVPSLINKWARIYLLINSKLVKTKILSYVYGFYRISKVCDIPQMFCTIKKKY
ncbi:hypothetical protein [Spiroplasma endosymbiont of Asaphidion curtum]|uniref:hypothetical protein n=1 Tax=Spiroplasma endosymbiont of Asaphidion curtum TaxID=3066281 RepID=UPI00313E09F1